MRWIALLLLLLPLTGWAADYGPGLLEVTAVGKLIESHGKLYLVLHNRGPDQHCLRVITDNRKTEQDILDLIGQPVILKGDLEVNLPRSEIRDIWSVAKYRSRVERRSRSPVAASDSGRD